MKIANRMRTLLPALLVLAPVSTVARELVVFADLTSLPDAGYAHMKEPGCDNSSEPGDEVVICVGGWSRYRLSEVIGSDRVHRKDTIALILSDPLLGGRWRLVLERLDVSAAKLYGASYKVDSGAPVNQRNRGQEP